MLNSFSPLRLSPAENLVAVMATLRAVFSRHVTRAQSVDPLFGLIWRYLGRVGPRLERLLVRWRAGRLPAARTPRTPAPTRAPLAPVERLRLPSAQGWLIRRVQPTAQLTGQLQALLDDDEMQALLAATPLAGRILRPLFRMLGIAPLPPELRPPPTPPPAPPPTLSAQVAVVPPVPDSRFPPVPPSPQISRP